MIVRERRKRKRGRITWKVTGKDTNKVSSNCVQKWKTDFPLKKFKSYMEAWSIEWIETELTYKKEVVLLYFFPLSTKTLRTSTHLCMIQLWRVKNQLTELPIRELFHFSCMHVPKKMDTIFCFHIVSLLWLKTQSEVNFTYYEFSFSS